MHPLANSTREARFRWPHPPMASGLLGGGGFVWPVYQRPGSERAEAVWDIAGVKDEFVRVFLVGVGPNIVYPTVVNRCGVSRNRTAHMLLLHAGDLCSAYPRTAPVSPLLSRPAHIGTSTTTGDRGAVQAATQRS